MKGLTDPMVGLLMGQTAENLAHRFGITREQMDAFAVRSHQRVLAAQRRRTSLRRRRSRGRSTTQGQRSTRSTTACGATRRSRTSPSSSRSSTASTATSPPGNSSQITDGAAWLVLASEACREAARSQAASAASSTPQWAGLDPGADGPGPGARGDADPASATASALDDLDYWEINEAFAAQVLGCLRGVAGREVLPRRARPDGRARRARRGEAQRRRRRDRARPSGGRSGTRIVLHLLKVLKRNDGKRGMASHLHRRRPGRRDAGGGASDGRAGMRHWHALAHWDTDKDGAGLADLRQAGRVDQHAFARRCSTSSPRRSTRSSAIAPKGLIIRSAQGRTSSPAPTSRSSPRFKSPRGGARLRARCGWDVFAAAARPALPDHRDGQRLLHGRRPRARARLPLPRGARRPGDPLRAARSDARHRAGVARHASGCRS